jgi:hypothetical protein
MMLYLEANIVEDLAYMFLKVIIANYSILKEMISDKTSFLSYGSRRRL